MSIREKKIPLLKIKYRPIPLSITITNSADAIKVLRNIWSKELFSAQEQVYLMFLNGNNQVICYKDITKGKMDETLFDIRLTLALALTCLAAKIIVAHNHPSGVLRPSEGDISVTRQLRAACNLMDIKLIDHLIINDKDYYSFKDNCLVV